MASRWRRATGERDQRDGQKKAGLLPTRGKFLVGRAKVRLGKVLGRYPVQKHPEVAQEREQSPPVVLNRIREEQAEVQVSKARSAGKVEELAPDVAIARERGVAERRVSVPNGDEIRRFGMRDREGVVRIERENKTARLGDLRGFREKRVCVTRRQVLDDRTGVDDVEALAVEARCREKVRLDEAHAFTSRPSASHVEKLRVSVDTDDTRARK